MNEEFTTQVDEACEDTSNRNQCDLREFHKRFCETYRSKGALWCMWKILQVQKYFIIEYTKFTRLKKNTATVEDDTHTEYTLNEAY